jgi:hypothetical protein
MALFLHFGESTRVKKSGVSDEKVFCCGIALHALAVGERSRDIEFHIY